MAPPFDVFMMAAVLVPSAVLHTTTGFGYALLSAPVLAAVVSPREAVSTILSTAVVVVLVLAGHGRRPSPRLRDALVLSAWSLPGLVIGAALLRVLPVSALQLLAAEAVFFAVWMVAAGAWIEPPSLPVLWLAVAFGYLVGRRLFSRMDVSRYERAVLVVLVVAALTALLNALT